MKPARTHQIFKEPQSWCNMPWGEYFRDALTKKIQPYLAKIYGFHMLKIGSLSTEIKTHHCSILHQVNVANKGNQLQVIASITQLPFKSKSIDACLLSHTLTWVQDPHSVLREVDRILIDDGWIIISGFNPFSILGISKGIPSLERCAPWNGRMFGHTRLLDWLSLLNYEVIYSTRFQVIPWRRKKSKIINKYFPIIAVFGCLNIVVARKRTFPLTPTNTQKKISTTQLFPVINTMQYYLRNKKIK